MDLAERFRELKPTDAGYQDQVKKQREVSPAGVLSSVVAVMYVALFLTEFIVLMYSPAGQHEGQAVPGLHAPPEA